MRVIKELHQVTHESYTNIHRELHMSYTKHIRAIYQDYICCVVPASGIFPNRSQSVPIPFPN